MYNNKSFSLAILQRHSSGVTGSTIKIDSSGDSEGNFSVLALKPYKMTRDNFSCDLHMVPVAYFQQGRKFPVSEFFFVVRKYKSKNKHKSMIKAFQSILKAHFTFNNQRKNKIGFHLIGI